MTAAHHVPALLGRTGPGSALSAALDAAGRGWNVFPVRRGQKVPAIERWEEEATRDPARIHTWWDRDPLRNVGVACGPSGLLVLDLDDARGDVPPAWAELGVRHGRDVLALLAQRARQPDPVDTFTVATPRNGEHRYFLRPPGLPLRSTAGTAGRGLGWRVDTRGPGSLVIAAGSFLEVADGLLVPYRVVNDTPPVPLPPWLARRLTPRPPPPRPADPPERPSTPRRITAYVNAAVAGEVRNVATAEHGERHIRLFAAAAALGELAANGWITDAEIVTRLTDAARHHLGVAEFTWHELTTTIRDGIAAGRTQRRILPDRPHHR